MKYIVEKIYQTIKFYIEEEPFKNKRKLKIEPLINFMPNVELKSKKLRYRDVKNIKMKFYVFEEFAFGITNKGELLFCCYCDDQQTLNDMILKN